MKAVLEFNLPEEQEEFTHSQNGSSYKNSLDKIDNFIRNKIKHGNLSLDTTKELEELRCFIHESVN